MNAKRVGRVSSRTVLPVAIAACLLLVGSLVVNAATRGEVAKKRRAKTAFIVKGEMVTTLRPGVKSQVKVSLANKKYTAIWVKSLRMSVSIDVAHAAAGCSVGRDFRVTQLPRKAFPLKLTKAKKQRKARGSKKKRKAKVRWRAITAKKAKGLPAIEMVNLPDVNQDACKGATLNLKFTGKATNKKPKRKKRTR